MCSNSPSIKNNKVKVIVTFSYYVKREEGITDVLTVESIRQYEVPIKSTL